MNSCVLSGLSLLCLFLIFTPSFVLASKRSCLRELKKCGKDFEDDTELLNRLFTYSGKIKIPSGSYYIDATKGVRIGKNTKVFCSDKVVFHCIPNDRMMYNIFLIQEAQNVEFHGGTIIGDRYQHNGYLGEHGMGISILDSKYVIIKNVTIQDAWGDALYVGSKRGSKGGKCENIIIKNCLLSNCRRQGISVVACDGFTVKNTKIFGIKGTAPEAGIDFEVNYKNNPSKRLIVDHCIIQGCHGPSIVVGNAIKDLTVRNSNLDRFTSTLHSKSLKIRNSAITDIQLGGIGGTIYKCNFYSVGLMNYGSFTFKKCNLKRIFSSKNTSTTIGDINISASFIKCSFSSPTENSTQEGQYAYETMAYFTIRPKSLKFEHCKFTIKDTWGIQLSVEDSLKLSNCTFSYKPSKQESWGDRYGFLHLKSNDGYIIFEDNKVNVELLTQYTASGLIRTYAPHVKFNRNHIKTSLNNLGTHVVRVNNAVNKTIEMNNNKIQGNMNEGFFKEDEETKLSNKLNRK